MTDKQAVRAARKKTLIGKGVQPITLRVRETERDILYKIATKEFRSINTEVIHRLGQFFSESPGVDMSEKIHAYNQALNNEKMTFCGLRLPVELYQQLQETAKKLGCPQNAILRYSIFAKENLLRSSG